MVLIEEAATFALEHSDPCSAKREQFCNIFFGHNLRRFGTSNVFKQTKSTDKSHFSLLLLEIPTFIKDLAPAEVVKDSTAYLECQVTGTSPFDITWYRDAKEIKSGAKYSFSQLKGTLGLEVHKSGTADAGEYQCTVANEVGSCTSKATLKLKGEMSQASGFRFAP